MRSTSSSVNESAAAETGGGSPGEIMLFGVRVVVDSMRKSVSLNNLSQYEQPHDATDVIANDNYKNDLVSVNNKDDVAAGYASADDAVPNARGNRERERKRGVPWTEEEHKLFLIGLQQVGKGDWRGISRNFVKTRTPTQVASHAQKYFLRRSNLNRRRRRSSLFDITTDTVTAAPMVEEPLQRKEIPSQSHSFTPSTLPEISKNKAIPIIQTLPVSFGPTPLATPTKNLMENCGPREVNTQNDGSLKLALSDSIFSSNQIRHESSSAAALSLRLSLTPDQRETSSRHSTFQSIPSFNNGDGIISAA
ncbi:transcription factor MYB1R1 [Cucumis melo var. makuwa]|uniref:Transcription factor MYB1R1 n=2 Tax=Cucumis melo TaxID=3656 RepID=A0A5A7UWD5_CUCMM|nr:transcription factor MYB1R1 [Cucumis melo]KAA0057905.1 transcription factor MYB1R1 [Cucumis melo var. makuwa]